MAQSRIKERQEAAAARLAQFDATLKKPRTREVRAIGEITSAIAFGFNHRTVRDPAKWDQRIKSRNLGKIRLAFARYAFALYPVPFHLELVWLNPEQLAPSEELRRRTWYLDVAQGRSLYRTQTKAFLTRRETHVFLAPSAKLTFREALWYSIARSYTDDHGTALRVARSKIARDRVEPFWRSAAAFFAQNDVRLTEINDFCDFFAARLACDPDYTLKGRTLSSLRARMDEWHRDLARIQRVGGGVWAGSPIGNWSFRTTELIKGRGKVAVSWTATQIKTGKELAEEGNRMRHCVYTYKRQCMAGRSSIWSLRANDGSATRRVLTIEMDADRKLVQIRGFANRAASPDEMRIVRRWAGASGIRV